MKDIFKEQLHNYQSPLSSRVSFDKVIAQTNKQNKPIWLNPRVIASAGLFLVIGTAIVAYYSAGAGSNASAGKRVAVQQVAQNEGSNSSQSTIVQHTATNLIENTVSNNEAVFPISITQGTNPGANSNKPVETVTPISKSVSKPAKSPVHIQEIPIATVQDPIKLAAVTSNTGETDAYLGNAATIEVVSTSNTQKGNLEYTKQEIVIGGSNTIPVQNNATNQTSETVYSEVANPDLALTANTPETNKNENLEINKEPNSSKWQLETNILSNARGINGTVNNVSLLGNQRTFGANAIVLYPLTSNLNVGLGIAFDAQSNIGTAQWNTNESNMQITSRDIVIVQPGLPNTIRTVYDTAMQQNTVNNNLKLAYNAQIVSLPIAIRYNIGQWNEFGLWLSNTAQPGIITAGLGHVFNNNEWNKKVQNTKNSMVLINRTGLRLTYDLGKRQSFILEPNMTLQWNSNKNLNTNALSQYGVGVGILFKL